MSNFYKDNPDIEFVLDRLDLGEVAGLLEEDFKFKNEYEHAPENEADAIDNYKKALEIAGDISGETIAATAEDTDRTGNILNADGTVTYTPGISQALDLLGQSGLMGLTLPYRFGGLNMPCTVLTAANDIVSRADVSLMNLFGLQGIAETINAFADEETKAKYVPRLASGELTGAMVLTEPDAGSDLQGVKTTASLDENGVWRVNGVKRFITNGCGDVLLVLARTEPEFSDARGLSCLLVEKCPQVRVRRLEHKLGINGSPTCELVFDNAPAILIGQRKRGLITYVMSLMNGARIGIAAQSLGVGESAYRAARDYASSRKQFGVAIDTFPALRELLCDMSVDLQAARALAYYASRGVDMENGLQRKFENMKGSPDAPAVRKRAKLYAAFNKMLTPMAKYFGSEMAIRVTNGAVAVLGGSGYMKDYPVERYLRDARICSIYEGTSQLQIVAAIGGVMGGTVREVIDDIFGSFAVPESLKEQETKVRKLLEELESAVQSVRENPLGKPYAEISARRLVDVSIAVIVGALFIKFAAADTARAKTMEWWFASKYPEARAALERVLDANIMPVDDFEAIAPYRTNG